MRYLTIVLHFSATLMTGLLIGSAILLTGCFSDQQKQFFQCRLEAIKAYEARLLWASAIVTIIGLSPDRGAKSMIFTLRPRQKVKQK